jgi:hypothetical protein
MFRLSLRTLMVEMLVAPPIIVTTWWAWRNTLLGMWLALFIVGPLHFDDPIKGTSIRPDKNG